MTTRSSEAQPVQVVREGSYLSAALRREQPYTYLLPASATREPGRRYPLLILLHGLTSNHREWATRTRLARYAAAYELVIALPEGGAGWYTNAYDGSGNYEDDLIGDFIPHLQATLPLAPPGKRWAIGGLSMGGYGAIKTALRYPELFALGVSHSGAFEETRRQELHPVFGDPQEHRALRRSADVFMLASDALCRWPTQRPRLYLDCGADDRLLPGNRRFHEHLNFLGYHHTYQEMPGQHTWPYWDRAIRLALPVITAMMAADNSEITTSPLPPPL